MSQHDWAWLGEIKDENFAVPIYLSTIVSTKAPKLTLGSHCCQPKSVNSSHRKSIFERVLGHYFNQTIGLPNY